MNAEQFEFALSQYIDGTLPIEQRAAVEERLRADPEARKLLEEYRNLDQAIRASAAGVPEIQWDRLARHLSEAVNDAADSRNYYIGWVRGAVGLAVAASVLLVIGLFLGHPIAPPAPPQAVAMLDVAGPQAEAAAGPAAIDISVSQPQEADVALAYTSGEGVLVQRPLVALAGFTR
jgi:anti-sigma factor RsiW